MAIFRAGLAAVEGRAAVRRALAMEPSRGPLAVVAVGKAAQSMALGARDALGDRIGRALVISKTGHLDFGLLRRLGMEAIESSHPVPDARTLQAGHALVRFIEDTPGDWPLLFLISGGTSSLVDLLPPGITLEQLRETNRWLLASGLAIEEMNRVRGSLSLVKAGGLLNWVGERPVQGLLISDVPDDDPGVIGSGLLVPAPDPVPGMEESPELPAWLLTLIQQGLQARRSPPSGVRPQLCIVARLSDAMRAAAQRGSELGYQVLLHDEFQQGDAAETGRAFAYTLLASPPRLHVWGGETVVQLPEQPGRGGRNQHLALAAAIELAGREGVYLLSAGTDGTDGPGTDAGALVDGGTVRRGERQGLDAVDCLARADAGTLLAASGDLLCTGATGTNVMDLMLGLSVADRP